MSIRATKAVLCHPCGAALTSDDRGHYLYACHDCAMHEHDLIRLHLRDPGHPDCEALMRSPVDLGLEEPKRRPLPFRSAA